MVHFDGKMLPDLKEMMKVDRLAVILTFDGKEQFLGAPKIRSGKGKGKLIAQAIHALLLEWEIVNRVQAFSFDTTAVNTGPVVGAAVLLEQLLERDVLYLPCRHHIYELVLRATFENKFGKTSGPEVPMFARFREGWNELQSKTHMSGVQDDEVSVKIPVSVQIGIKSFCLNLLKEKHARADYKEFLELVLLFLGEDLGEYHFKKPGAISHARWMSKAIYSLKVFLFRKHFRLTQAELNGLRDVCIFIVLLYVKAWFGCARAVEAPNQDLNFLKSAAQYKTLDEKLAKQIVLKFIGHTWYLTGETVSLALFDSSVSDDIKRKMVRAIRSFENDEDSQEYEEEEEEEQAEDSGGDEGDMQENVEEQVRPARIIGSQGTKKVLLAFKDINDEFMKNDLSHFVTVDTKNFFLRFELPAEFLDTDPEVWAQREDYQYAVNILKKLHVVNDTAERGVKLIEDYNDKLCRDIDEKECLLQVVNDYRKKFPSFTKNKLT